MVARIILTHNCNLRCKHCLRSHYDEGDLELDILNKFLVGYKNSGLGNFFNLTGGEPTFHKKFSEVLSLLKKTGFKGSIITNGQDEKKINDILFFRETIKSVIVSLEGPSSFVNDRIRGKGSFKNAMRSIEILTKNKISVGVKFTLNVQNANYLKPMFIIADLYGIDRLHISPIMPCIKTEKNNLDMAYDDIMNSYKVFMKLKEKYPAVKSEFRQNNIIKTTIPDWPMNLCPTNDLTLLPNGDISFCCDLANYDFYQDLFEKNNDVKLNHILGNVNTNNFKDILKNRNDLANILARRRKDDSRDGSLSGLRQFVCENCKYYFFKK
jgi:MoaA/NifB/PqqE/SkfB family radical SAM enzyme